MGGTQPVKALQRSSKRSACFLFHVLAVHIGKNATVSAAFVENKQNPVCVDLFMQLPRPPLTDWVVHSHMSSCMYKGFAKCPRKTQLAPTTRILPRNLYFRYCFGRDAVNLRLPMRLSRSTPTRLQRCSWMDSTT